MLRLIIPVKSMIIAPMTTAVSGGLLTIGAILGQAGGTISESTGIALGFVGGIVTTAALLSWFFRGYLDKIEADVTRVDTKHANEIIVLKGEIFRLKKKMGVD